MKKILFLLVLTAGMLPGLRAQTCSSCGGSGVSLGDDTSPSLDISLGTLQFGLPAGDLSFDGSLPIPQLVTPASLQLSAPLPDLITVVNNADGSLRQVNAPQALADIPVPPTTNGYVINLYYPSHISWQTNVYQVTGNPFATWMITNADPNGAGQLQVSESMSGSLLKQWTYTYSTSTGAWTVQDLAGVAETMILTNLNSSLYQVINSVQYASGSVAQLTAKTYQNFNWGSALVQIAVGATNAPEVTTYTYYDPAPYTGGNTLPVRTVVNPDGSWEWYGTNAYDSNGNITNVYSSFGDITLAYATNNAGGGARRTLYTYDPTAAGVSDSGDNGTCNAIIPRRTINYIGGQEVSRSYTVFPAVNMRLDILCTTPGAAWNASGNLTTTNYFYSNPNDPNQFALQSVIRPDGTMTAYNYITNGLYRTNITVYGQANASYTGVVDGVSNVVVLNYAGYTVSSAAYDVRSGVLLASDTYGNFDSYGRPQQVTHLDNTTEQFAYDCCGLDTTVNKDGVTTEYLYDPARRQIGYEQVFNTSVIAYTNLLDAAGRALQSIRVGSDNSSIVMGQSGYDLAGELIARTNALNGATFYTRTNDPATGGLIRTTINPDGGGVTNYYYADGSLKKAVGTALHGKACGYGYATDVNNNTCTYTAETNLNTDGSLSSEWTKTFTDMAGRTTEVLFADGSKSLSFYNAKGQLWKQVDPDNVTTLYTYNGRGEVAHAITALNSGTQAISSYSSLISSLGTITGSGSTDRITQTTNDVTSDHGANVRRSRTFAWLDGQSTGTLVSQTETSADGLSAWQTRYRDAGTPVTSTNTVSYGGNSRTVINNAPDGSYAISLYSYGRLSSSTRYDSTSAQIGATTYSYDAHGRQYQVTDARNGTTTYGYNNADQVNSVAAPMSQTTTTHYDNMLRPDYVTQPDNTVVNSVYLLTGELGMQYGSRTYPVAYTYDYAGRMKTMTTWTNYATSGGAAVTTWKYDGYRGFLTNKVFDDGKGPSYQYTSAGRLWKRAWARMVGGQPLVTTYKYDNAGGLTNVIYSDSTPGVTNVYDRLGRLSRASWTNITDTLTYNLANELLSESFSGGILNGLSVTNGYDADLRRTALAALQSNNPLIQQSFGFDAASRLSTVLTVDGGLGTLSATYNYIANSPLVGQITFKSNSVTRMTTTKQYDYLNRLTQISSVPSGTGILPVSFNYNYNLANQRTKDVLADGSYWVYQYDALGQATNGVKYFADGTLVPGQQFGYLFDDIGNRKQTQSGGDQSGAGLRPANYTVNNLNQITVRDYPGTNDIIGASIMTNAVMVNGQTAWRKEEYFWATVKSNNTAAAQWEGVSVVSGSFTNNGNLLVPQTPQNFIYDADGNLVSDGLWTNVWNTENRLVCSTSLTNVPSGGRMKEEWSYLPDGRWSQRIVSSWNGSAYVPQYTNKFVWDGQVLAAIVDQTNGLVMSFMRGLDLSGSLQGAGGVGGLLAVSFKTNGTHFAAFDGNGNVAALVSAADGTATANYEYGPFGEAVRITGTVGRLNPIRFSTQFADDVRNVLKYLYREYTPSTGIWPNRDPLDEPGFELLRNAKATIMDSRAKRGLSRVLGGRYVYQFLRNNPVDFTDLYGLDVNNVPPCSPYPDCDYPPTPTPVYDPWDDGYMNCWFDCMLGLPTVSHVLQEAGGNNVIARSYYLKTDGRFKACGKCSKVLVPKLASKLSLVGWFVSSAEACHCASKCSELVIENGVY
jgi:RHS repeat-associated protein